MKDETIAYDKMTAEEMAAEVRALTEQLHAMGRNDLLLKAIGVPMLEELRIEAARGQLSRLLITHDFRFFLLDYERKEVVDVDGVNAAVLYDRAMMALSDWTGPDGKAKAGIDYQNQETHTVIYKGTFSLGFKNVFLGDGWNRYANFTVKVRCKDGRAQVTVNVGTLTAALASNGRSQTFTLGESIAELKKRSGKRRERGEETATYITDTADNILQAMKLSLQGKGKNADDDF
jgi:hypothetical protein